MYSKYDAILTAIQAVQTEAEACADGDTYEDATEEQAAEMAAEFDAILETLYARKAAYLKRGK